ncbi:homing endonuclease associated repeat-containing protein [Halorubrum vacuolatum]|uniref:C2H2-type domain-containing protein n=1 Tax=Halorubrum vacuolatum TaxID=63740 RepID=A0A238WYJ5_HALVU|nr:hypothetical protein [Halorubrum vacuolatum]SNR51745.1 hypothetical protein SAMN06264855_11174 [Halorubrum vacuolatum]
MSDQSTLTDFTQGVGSDGDLYDCEVCGRTFDSNKGRGIHRAAAHSEDEVRGVLITELQRLAERLGHPPGLRDMNQLGAHSSKTYQDMFGSWNEALKAADLDINMEQNISKSDLLDELARLADELGRTPTSRDMAQLGEYGTATYSKTFESWNNAVQEAGLEIIRYRNIPRDALINEIRRLSDCLGRTPTAEDMETEGEFGAKTFSTKFGTWNNALRSAGFEPNRQKNLSKEVLIAELTRLEDKYGRPPTAKEMEGDGLYSVGTFSRSFGSWNEALISAGFEVHNRTNIPKEELLTELSRLHESLGRTPTVEDMDILGRFAHATYSTAFGTWNNALREAGLDLHVRSGIPEAELLDELRSLARELEITPERRDMDQHGQFDSKTYSARFGTWNDALRAAGLEPVRRVNIPNDELRSELRRLTDKFGRPPTRDEMTQHGKFGHSVYSHRFGSWTDALIEAGLEPHKMLNPDHLDHWVASVLELKVAELLVDIGVEYEYEGLTIEYDDGRSYTPDFVTADYVIECKGQDWGDLYNQDVTAEDKAEAAMDSLETRKYVVIGAKIPADIHIRWDDRAAIHELFE